MPQYQVRCQSQVSYTTRNLIRNETQCGTEVKVITEALINAKRPLIITGYLGRNLRAPALLEALCDKLPIEALETIGSDVCIRSSHEAYRGVTVSTHPTVREADVILVLDCDVPWVPTQGAPSKGKIASDIFRWLCLLFNA